MKPSLLSSLLSPNSFEPFELLNSVSDGSAEEILEGELRTVGGVSYPIISGIPCLLDSNLFASGQKETVDNFSEKWNRAPGYREATRPHYEAWFLERYGFKTVDNLRTFLSSKTRILDAGTGHGRDAQLYAENSSAEVFGIDISEGIKLAYRDLKHLSNLHLIRADLRYPPFAKNYFDFIACDQVIHHTPDTFDSLKRLLEHLAPGGHIAFYVYKVKGPIREFCDDYIRSRSTKMSAEECMELSESMTKLGKALADLKVKVDIPVDIPLLGIEKGTFDIQRWIYWNVFKCYWNDTIDWDSNVITNFDWYHPLHAHRHTVEEVKSWLEACSLVEVHMSVVESGISVLAKKCP